MSELLTFLSHIWGSKESAKFLASKLKPQTGQEDEVLFKIGRSIAWPANKEIIEQAIMAGNASGVDMYFAPAGFMEGATTKDKSTAAFSRVLWIDIDGYKEGQDAPSAALQRLIEDAVVPVPTYRNQTSQNGQHWYWILDDYYPPELIEDYNRRLAYYLGADKACWNIDRVLRPPFTHNHKPQYDKPAVDIIAYNEQVYSPDEFSKLPTVREQLKDVINFGDIPSVEEVLAKYPWDSKHLEVFKINKEQFWNDKTKDYQNRGNAMMRIAYFGAEVGMSDEAIYAILNDMDNRWEKFKDRKDRERRLVEFLNKVREKYPSSVFKVQMKQTQEEVQRIYGFKSFLESNIEYRWLIKDLIAETTINFLTSTPGVGKSRLALQLGLSFATGTNFLSYENVGGKKKVAWLSLEMGRPILKHFIKQLAQDNPNVDLDELEKNYILVPQGEPLELASPDGFQFFKYILDTEKPDVMVIDAMGSLSIDDITAKEAKLINNRLKAALNEYGTTFYIIHHNRKPSQLAGDKPPTLADFYGNTYGSTDAASVQGLWRPPGKDHYELHTLKARTEREGKPVMLDGSSRFSFSVRERLEDNDGNSSYISRENPAPPEQFGFGFLGTPD